MSAGQHFPTPAAGQDPPGLPHVLVLSQVQVEQLAMVFGLALDSLLFYGDCTACDASPADLCSDHAADLDRHDDFRALALDLGVEVAR
jgi:hypothetical protein